MTWIQMLRQFTDTYLFYEARLMNSRIFNIPAHGYYGIPCRKPSSHIYYDLLKQIEQEEYDSEWSDESFEIIEDKKE